MPRIAVIGVAGGWSSEMLTQAVQNATGWSKLIEMQEVRFDVNRGRATFQGFDLSDLDGIIVKKIGNQYSPDLLNRLEMLSFLEDQGKVKIFSRPGAMARAIDRMSNTLVLRRAGVPLPPTVITENSAEAAEAIREFGTAIIKPLYTSKARGMLVLNASDDISHELAHYREEGNAFFYVQKALDLGGRDYGLVFLGGEYLASYARVGSGNSWNTTTNSGGKYSEVHPEKEIIDIACVAEKAFGLDFTCVDVAITPDGPVVFEVSAFGGFRGLLDANQIDAAQLYTNYAIRKIQNA